MATYTAPRVDEYELSIKQAHSGGLTGEYFNNRWLYGEPASTQLDHTVDLQWDADGAVVTESGDEFGSIRWTGYIQPAFDEVYTFTVYVNDGLKLWVGDELLIDEYENEVDDSVDGYAEFSATTSNALTANQLVAMKIEYQEKF